MGGCREDGVCACLDSEVALGGFGLGESEKERVSVDSEGLGWGPDLMLTESMALDEGGDMEPFVSLYGGILCRRK